VAWDEAIATAATSLKSSTGRVALSLSPRLTCEDLYAWRLLAEALSAQVSVRQIVRGEDDRLLLRADKGGNSQGAAWIVGQKAIDRSLTDALRGGGVDVLIVVGDPLDPADTPGLPAGASVGRVIFVGPHEVGAAEAAQVALPTAAWTEEDGTVVNFQGHLQRVQRAHLPHGEGRPGWRIVRDLAEAAGMMLPGWTAAAEVFASASAAVPELAGLAHADIGILGVRAGGVSAGVQG
jgi:NADH dehydrogenase/NADH:ubiquinone oxidoreductase subunit G